MCFVPFAREALGFGITNTCPFVTGDLSLVTYARSFSRVIRSEGTEQNGHSVGGIMRIVQS